MSKSLGSKILLVLLKVLVKVTPTMKRIYTLIVLLGLAMGTLLTGCNKESDTSTPPASTNPPTSGGTTNP
jgi:hypothetical protein